MKAGTGDRIHIAAGLLALVALGLSVWGEHVEDRERRELSDTSPTPPAGPCAPCIAARLKRERAAEAARLAATTEQSEQEIEALLAQQGAVFDDLAGGVAVSTGDDQAQGGQGDDVRADAFPTVIE